MRGASFHEPANHHFLFKSPYFLPVKPMFSTRHKSEKMGEIMWNHVKSHILFLYKSSIHLLTWSDPPPHPAPVAPKLVAGAASPCRSWSPYGAKGWWCRAWSLNLTGNSWENHGKVGEDPWENGKILWKMDGIRIEYSWVKHQKSWIRKHPLNYIYLNRN